MITLKSKTLINRLLSVSAWDREIEVDRPSCHLQCNNDLNTEYRSAWVLTGHQRAKLGPQTWAPFTGSYLRVRIYLE